MNNTLKYLVLGIILLVLVFVVYRLGSTAYLSNLKNMSTKKHQPVSTVYNDENIYSNLKDKSCESLTTGIGGLKLYCQKDTDCGVIRSVNNTSCYIIANNEVKTMFNILKEKNCPAIKYMNVPNCIYFPQPKNEQIVCQNSMCVDTRYENTPSIIKSVLNILLGNIK